MRHAASLLLACLLCPAIAAAQPVAPSQVPAPPHAIKNGDKAPGFLRATISLDRYRGTQTVAIGGCEPVSRR